MTSIDRQDSSYVDLLKRCLTDSILIDDPLANLSLYRAKAETPAWKRRAISALRSFLARYRLQIVEPRWVPWDPGFPNTSADELLRLRSRGLGWPARAQTLIGLQRLDNIQYCVETVLQEGVPGDLIETGVWRGGACIFMRAILKAHGDQTRAVWLADSFTGLPLPNAADYPADAGDKHHAWNDFFAVSRAEVEANFRRYGLLDGRVRFLEGWFKDTLPTAPIERLAVMRLDGDMYESTMQALEALYPKLSPGGFVIVDDYYLPPCARAINDFRGAQGIADPIREIDGNAVFWRRASQ